jgi:hypothetical protein
MISGVLHPVRVLVAPSAVFADLARHPRWLTAFVLISALFLIPLQLSTPSAGQLAANHVRDVSGGGIDITHTAIMLLLPVGLLLKWTLFSAVLFLLVHPMAGSTLRFKAVYATVVHSESTLVIMAMANTLMFSARPPDTGEDLHVFGTLNLGTVMQSCLDNRSLLALAHQVTLFDVWHVALLTIGLSIISGLTRSTSLAIVGSVWLLGAAILAGVTAFLSGG